MIWICHLLEKHVLTWSKDIFQAEALCLPRKEQSTRNTLWDSLGLWNSVARDNPGCIAARHHRTTSMLCNNMMYKFDIEKLQKHQKQ